MNDGNNPFQPPSAAVADLPVDGAEPATRGSRLLAVLADTAIQVAVMLAINALLPWSIWNVDASPGQLLVNLVVGLLVFAMLQGWMLVRHGQTLGKRALGLRIVRTDGSRAGAGRLLGLRYGLGWVLTMIPLLGSVYALIDALLIFRADRRCLHDLIAGTIVVRA